MSFLKEAEARIAAREAESAGKQAKNQARIDRENALHKQRKDQAEAYFKEAGIAGLIARFAKAVVGEEYTGRIEYDDYSHPSRRTHRTYGRLDDEKFNGPCSASFRPSFRHISYSPQDPDSVSYGIFWKEKDTGVDHREIRPVRDWHDMENRWSEFTGKFIAAEVQPDGPVIFHAGTDIIVPKVAWQEDHERLEYALDRAYREPQAVRYKGEQHVYDPKPWIDLSN